ncbi:MAG: ribonuclease J, partial [Chloroflexota bacterium]
EQVQNHPHDKIVVLTTGTQGEPTSALVRMANGEHPQIRIVPGDTVVMSATPIPGNEATVSRTIDNLFRLGANVIYGAASRAHVHGHGSQEELKTILNLVRPKYFVPIHGCYRHLARHALMAEQMGIPKENVFLLEDGDVLELTGNSGKVVGKVPANDIVANGLVTGALDTKMLRDRRILSRDGIVVVSVVLSPQTGKLVAPPEIVSKGFVDSHGNVELIAGAQKAVTTIASRRPFPKRKSTMEARIREVLSKYFYDETHRRPVIMPMVTGLESDDKE